MVNFVSPGVYVIEKDISDYTPAINPTVVGIVGFAGKGVPNKPTLITSQERLIKAFGRPTEDLPGQALEGSLEILETCNQLYFLRAMGSGTATTASATVEMGGCPAVAIFNSGTGYGVGETLYLELQASDNSGNKVYQSPKRIAIDSGTSMGGTACTTQAQAMATLVGGSLDGDKIGSYMTASSLDSTVASSIGNYIVANFAGSGAILHVKAFKDSSYTLESSSLYPVGASGLASGLAGVDTNGAPWNGISHQAGKLADINGGAVAEVKIRGTQFEDASITTAGMGYLVESQYQGNGYDASTHADGTITGNSITVSPLGSQNDFLNVNEDGATAESFKVSLVGSGAFVETVINTGLENRTSDIIKGNLMASGAIFDATKLARYTTTLSAIGATPRGAGGQAVIVSGTYDNAMSSKRMSPRFAKFVAGTDNMAGGTNGDGNGDSDKEADALIGEVGANRTGIEAFDDDLVPITIAAIPGITDYRVQNALITLAERLGFLAVFGTPLGLGQAQDAIDYSNGRTPYRTTAMNSSYAALYFPQVKVFNTFYGKDMFYDPAIFAIRQMGFTDTVADLWFAPAGFVRGRLTKPSETEVHLNQGDRDALYSGGNIVNPITSFPQQGITIFGQRTTQRASTALDRINVRRLMIYIKRVIEASTKRFIFEPNDKITQERIQTLLTPLFEDIKRRRGITEFKVVCDETTNTPERVDRNELWCKVLIKPTKAAEVLIFELNVASQGATISG